MSKLKSIPTRQAAEQTLVITRTFDAPRRLVFQAWTEPERVKRWWGPKTFTTPVCEIDLRLGGLVRSCMRSPDGLDAALLTAGGEAAEQALTALREGGRVAYPNGVEPEPQARPGLIIQNYDGVPDPQAIEKLNRLIASGPFEVHIARTFSLEQAAEAHRALDTHYLGKLVLRPR